MSGGGKKLRRWLRALLILFALIAGIAMLLGFLVFSSPETFAIRQVAVDDTVVQAALASNIYMQVQNAAPGKTAEVVLPPDQVDALIQIAVNGAAVYRAMNAGESAPQAQDYTACYRDGMVEFRSSINTGETWLDGGAVVVSGRAMLTMERDGDEKIGVDEIRAGRLPLPGIIGEMALGGIMDTIRQSPEYAEFRPAIIEISRLDDGSVKIVYLPYQLRKYLEEIEAIMTAPVKK